MAVQYQRLKVSLFQNQTRPRVVLTRDKFKRTKE